MSSLSYQQSLTMLRIAAGLNQSEAALAAGITNQHLSRMECGRRPITAKQARKLMRMYAGEEGVDAFVVRIVREWKLALELLELQAKIG